MVILNVATPRNLEPLCLSQWDGQATIPNRIELFSRIGRGYRISGRLCPKARAEVTTDTDDISSFMTIFSLFYRCRASSALNSAWFASYPSARPRHQAQR